MRKNIKIIIIAVITVVCVGIVLFVIKHRKSVFNDKYDIPVVSYVTISFKDVTITGGIYQYGDVTKNGVIDEDDVNSLEYMVTGESFSEEENPLADINKDSKVDNADLDLLKSYVKNKKKTTYDTVSSNLLYCVSLINDSKNCKWQDSNKFDMKDEKPYYVFVKDKKTGKVSASHKFQFVKEELGED